jgi:hypothetical protein
MVNNITYNGKKYNLQDKEYHLEEEETSLTREGVIRIVRNVASNSKRHHL